MSIAPGYGSTAELRAQLEQLRADLAAARARVAELDETWTDELGTVWRSPTAWSYAMTCRARQQQQERAERAEADLAAARALRQERDAALADARRYRWLRSAKTGKPISCVTTGSAWRCTLNTVELDAAIDAALAGEKK